MNFHCIRNMQFSFWQLECVFLSWNLFGIFFSGMLPVSYTSVAVLKYSLAYIKDFGFPSKKKGVQKSRQDTWLVQSINSALKFDLYVIFLCSSQLGFSGVMYPKRQNLYCSDFILSIYKIIVTQRKLCSAFEHRTFCEDPPFPLEHGRYK